MPRVDHIAKVMLDVRETVSGVAGACCCVYAGLPFDVIKVRLQTQSTVNAYRGVFDACRRIAIDEGIRALWKGAIPALYSSTLENAVLFTANGMVHRVLLNFRDKELSTMDEAFMGSVSGIFSATAITPAEVVKCRLQVQRGRLGVGEYRGALDCFRKVLWKEGPIGLFRGYFALLLRDVPFNFFFFGTYNMYSSAFMTLMEKDTKTELHPLLVLTAGGLAGATGWSVVFPADVLKSYMQTSLSVCRNSLTSTATFLYRTHGIQGFYRGWTAAVIRSFPANGSLFLGVELTNRMFQAWDNKS